MKTKVFTLLIALMLFSLPAYAADAQLDKLHGSWKIDVVASMESDDSLHGLSAQEKELALEMAKAMLGQMTFSFDTKNMIVSFTAGDESESAPFTVHSREGDKLVLDCEGELMDVVFRNDGSIMFGDAEDMMVMKRQQ